MLAKQCWWLICDPASLAVRILKGKYFPDGSLWTAKLGWNPSYLWGRLIQGRKALESGSIQRKNDNLNGITRNLQCTALNEAVFPQQIEAAGRARVISLKPEWGSGRAEVIKIPARIQPDIYIYLFF